MTYVPLDLASERLSVAIVIAALVHAVVIYSVGFTMPKHDKLKNTTMEIILVPKSTEQAPKKANYLAQFNHESGGESEPDAHPSTPTKIPFPDQTANVVFTAPPPVAAAVNEHQIETLTTEKPAKHHIEQPKTVTPPNDEPAEPGDDSQTEFFQEVISENTLFINNASAAKLASIQAQLDEKFNAYAKRLRQKHISASTKEDKYANYMDAWRRKVEYIGNLNYPDKAHHQRLSGNLILDVALNPNGTIRHVEIKQPSEYRILDEAALRIVRLAAPFDPFPENIRQETDILHITRTWEFRYNSLTSR